MLMMHHLQKTKFGSPYPVQETLAMITVAARDVRLSAKRMSNSMVKLQDIRLLSRSMLDLTLSAEVNYRASGSAKFAVLENKMSLDVSLTRRTRTRMLARDQQRL